MARVAVVGGGISGLAAAWHLVTHSDHEVVVLEGSPQLGGKLRRAEIAGQQVDVGAESMLARRPEALELLGELGLPPVHPETGSGAALWSRDRLQPLPPQTLMGVPSDPRSARGALSADEVARAVDEHPVAVGDDISVGDLVEGALGGAVVDRLVEPLLGGVYAGHARLLSARACVPALYLAAAEGDSLTETAARAAKAALAKVDSPVFAGLRGGVGTLPEALAAAIRARGGQIRLGATVREVARRPAAEQGCAGWSLTLGPVPAPERLDVDAVVVTAPAKPTARMLRSVAGEVAALLEQIDYASMGIVTMAFDRAQLGAVPTGSGFLVPAVDGRTIKAATFSSGKWPWLADAGEGLFFLRVSMGRYREEAVLQRPDEELVARGRHDLAAALGRDLPAPVDTHVQRWGGGLPQYAVGHLARIAQAQTGIQAVDGLELAGAAYQGVGIPACIASARAAAERTLTHLRPRERDAR